MVSTLEESFKKTKEFCDARGILINATKTQFIIFRSPGKRIDDNIEIRIMDHNIQHIKTVKLLGFTLDRGLTFGPHISSIVEKCNGLLSVLAKASSFLPTELLKLAYVSLVRTNLEYSSAVYASAANSHLKRLDVVQKIASRIISHAPSKAHSAPLIEALGLQTLTSRRDKHIVQIVNNCINGNCHPAVKELFTYDHTSQELLVRNNSRIQIGKRKFSNFAINAFNSHSEEHLTPD